MASPVPTWGSRVTNSTAGTTCDITSPSLLDDDVIYAFIDQAVVTDPPTLSGWFEIEGVNHDGGRGTVLRKVITNAAGEPSSYVFTWTGNSRNVGVICRARGADTTTPEAIDGSNTGAGAPDPPSVDPGSSDDYLAIAGWLQEGKATTHSVVPSGYTDAAVDGGTTGGGSHATHCSLGFAHKEYTGQVEDPSAFTLSRADGHVAYVVIIAPAAVGQIIAVGTLATTDSLIGVAAQKTASVGVLAESDSLVGVQAVKVAPVGVLAEIDSPVGIQARKISSVGVFAEIDTLNPIAADKPIITPVGILSETDTPIAIQARKVASIGVLAEIDSLIPIAVIHPQVIAVGVLAETDSLIGIPARKIAGIGTLAELESLIGIPAGKIVNVGILTEIETLISILPRKVAPVGTISELEALLPIQPGKNAPVGVLAELNTLVAIEAVKPIVTAVGTLAEADSLIPITARKLASVGTIAEIDSLIPLVPQKTAIIGTILETDSLIPVTVVISGVGWWDPDAVGYSKNPVTFTVTAVAFTPRTRDKP